MGRQPGMAWIALVLGIAAVALPIDATEIRYTQVAKLYHTDIEPGDSAGYWVDIDGDRAIVGAPFVDTETHVATGAVYVFERDAGGPNAWGEVAKLSVADGLSGDWLGIHAAIDGDTVLAAAWVNDSFRQGYAYIFEREPGDGGAWRPVAKLLPDNGVPSDSFGSSAAIDGDVAVVGASLADTPNGRDGSVYVYERNAGGPDAWGQVAQLMPAAICDDNVTSCGSKSDRLFGGSVAVSGDTIAVGSSQNFTYLFQRQSDGTWRRVGRPVPIDVERADELGKSVAADGQTVVLGAPSHDAVANNAGAVFVLEPAVEGALPRWAENARLLALDGEAGDEAGRRVAIEGDTVVAGAPQTLFPQNWQGEAHVFRRSSSGTWHRVAELRAGDGEPFDQFGYAVGVSGGTVIVGALGDDDFGAGSGAAYIFEAVSTSETHEVEGDDSVAEVGRRPAAESVRSSRLPAASGEYCFKFKQDFVSYCDGLELQLVDGDITGTWLRWLDQGSCGDDFKISVSGRLQDGVVRVRCDPEAADCPGGFSWEWRFDVRLAAPMVMVQHDGKMWQSWIDELAYTATPGPCVQE